MSPVPVKVNRFFVVVLVPCKGHSALQKHRVWLTVRAINHYNNHHQCTETMNQHIPSLKSQHLTFRLDSISFPFFFAFFLSSPYTAMQWRLKQRRDIHGSNNLKTHKHDWSMSREREQKNANHLNRSTVFAPKWDVRAVIDRGWWGKRERKQPPRTEHANTQIGKTTNFPSIRESKGTRRGYPALTVGV